MDAEEDVNHFRFGKLGGKDAPIDHLSNAHIALLLKRIRAQKQEEAPNQRLPEIFEKSLAYATQFSGAVPVSDAATIDSLFDALHALELVTSVTDEGVEIKEPLHEYESIALANLFPSSVAAAKSLIPSLQRFADEALEEALKILRAAGSMDVASSTADTGTGGAQGE